MRTRDEDARSPLRIPLSVFEFWVAQEPLIRLYDACKFRPELESA